MKTIKAEDSEKIAAMELLMQRGYISLTKYIEFLRKLKEKK